MFIRKFFTRYQFSQSTANSFRSKTGLTEFYKATHPDLLSNAPDNVKEENLRSLKYLNSYFDSLSQNQRAEAVDLTFYLPNKSNKKARRFYPIQVSLTYYSGNVNEETQKQIINKQKSFAFKKQNNYRVTNLLANKIKEKQEEIDTAHLKDKPNSMGINFKKQWVSTAELNTIKDDILDSTGPLKRKSSNKKDNPDFIGHHLFYQSNQAQWEAVEKQVHQEMYHTQYIKSYVWQTLLNKDDNFMGNIFKVYDDLIDPRLIYVDQDLSTIEIKKFRERLIPSEKNMNDLNNLKSVFSDMESCTPQISLYITREYSSEDIPGFYSIPYNFTSYELKAAYMELKHNILRNRKEYNKEIAEIDKIESTLRLKHQIIGLKNNIQLKNTEEAKKTKIILLQLQNVLTDLLEDLSNSIQSEVFNFLKTRQIILSPQENKIEQDKIFIGPGFSLQKLLTLFQNYKI